MPGLERFLYSSVGCKTNLTLHLVPDYIKLPASLSFVIIPPSLGCCYSMTVVKMESWLDMDNTGKDWVKVDEYLDDGGW